MQAGRIRIGTRGSVLALAQANEVRRRLMSAHALAETQLETVVIKTSGDRIQDRPLSEAGGKGLFTKEIEEALLAGSIDLAVHSMKDMASVLPDGLVIGAYLPREDVRDAFVSLKCSTLSDLPKGAVVGTSSLRRQAQVLKLRPDVRIVAYRGNVDTRLRRLEDGVADATLLACAGLRRLGFADRITSPVPVELMLPAVAQGTIGIEIRAGDEAAAKLIAPLNHQQTALCVTAERAFLARLDGSCRTPIGGLAQLIGGRLILHGQILSPDGSLSHEASREGAPQEAIRMGEDAADELLAKAGPAFLGSRP
ncbi:MAG: hydroxymethylbilane synthase [Hyphomicrobiaceae bacterium]